MTTSTTHTRRETSFRRNEHHLSILSETRGKRRSSIWTSLSLAHNKTKNSRDTAILLNHFLFFQQEKRPNKTKQCVLRGFRRLSTTMSKDSILIFPLNCSSMFRAEALQCHSMRTRNSPRKHLFFFTSAISFRFVGHCRWSSSRSSVRRNVSSPSEQCNESRGDEGQMILPFNRSSTSKKKKVWIFIGASTSPLNRIDRNERETCRKSPLVTRWSTTLSHRLGHPLLHLHWMNREYSLLISSLCHWRSVWEQKGWVLNTKNRSNDDRNIEDQRTGRSGSGSRIFLKELKLKLCWLSGRRFCFDWFRRLIENRF